MLRTIQIFSIAMGAISLFFLADHWWHFGVVGVLLDIQHAYERALHFVFGWLEPYAKAAAVYFGLDLPAWWKDIAALYLTMAGATVRSSSFLLGFFSKAIADADRHVRDLHRERAQQEDEFAKREASIRQKRDIAYPFSLKPLQLLEGMGELIELLNERDAWRQDWQKRFDAARGALSEAMNSGGFVTGRASLVLLLAALLWPVVWLFDLVSRHRPGRGWLQRFQTSFVGLSMYEFSKIVAGALIFFAVNAYAPNLIT